MHSPLSKEVPAPDIKWSGKDVRLNSSNLPIQTKTFKSLHTFAGLRNAPYSSYRNVNRIEIHLSKTKHTRSLPKLGGCCPLPQMTRLELPFVMCCLAPVLSLLLGAMWNCASGADPAGQDSHLALGMGKVAPECMGRRGCEGDQPPLCCGCLSWQKDLALLCC